MDEIHARDEPSVNPDIPCGADNYANKVSDTSPVPVSGYKSGPIISLNCVSRCG
jgi:hypothetical protein